jgi:DNA-binding beta-propeller fold protein YncE
MSKPLCSALRGLGLLAIASACDAQPSSIAPPTKPFVIVANQRSGVATLVDVGSGRVSHVDLDARPHEVAVSPSARIAAFTIPSPNGIRASRKLIVLDLATAKVLRVVETGTIASPHGVAFVSDTVALIGDLNGTSVAWVDVRNGTVVRAVEGLPERPYVVAPTATGRAYVSSPHSSKVTEIDVASARLVRTIDIPDDPAGIAVSADGRELFAAVWRENTGGGIVIYDLERRAVAARLRATQPRRITVTADGRRVVVSDRNDVRVIERATRDVRSIALGHDAFGSGVACAPDSRTCYVALSQAGEIVEVDVVAARVLRRFPAQKGVDGVAYVPR